ncbi:MAG: phosphoribosylformylglycinamidine synthase subunit PurL [Bryobacter sp.]|nr:phosphoribosylformylglycinamidine synthase subunit PurL [Bryobacter sp.]
MPLEIEPELAVQLKKHKITPDEYEKILALLGRRPNLTELGIFSVMWSEHCSYKSSKVHLKKLPTENPRVLQGPGENAGIIDIGDGIAIAFKIESHNHPSFIEPFQGAATGVGGILRDIFTMGARPIAVMDALRFGRLDSPENGARNRRILSGVVEGISHYGNCFGVPTVGGETVFEDCYDGNPLVNVFALGVFRHEDIFYGRATGVGNPVIYVGARTGRDGIQGASMASDVFTEESKSQRPTVQVGDPFMEKLLLEACLEAMKTGAIVGIQDMGAAGLTCSTCEMGARGGTGIDFELNLVPQRERGMTPYEIMLSESQERMLLVAEKGREQEIIDVFNKWGLQSAVIGTVTDDGLLRVRKDGEVVAEIRNLDLADEAPLYHRPFTKPFREAPMEGPAFASRHLQADLLAMLASQDLCSKRWIWEQYDYMVRTNTLVGPGSDAAVVRIKESGTSIAMSLDGNGRYCYLDPREGAKLIVAECCRNLSTVGALPVAATNNLNFGNPERPDIMAQLVEAIEGMAEACRFFDTPITGGNVSLYNETLGQAIYPTPVIGLVGLLPTAKPVLMSLPQEGLALYLLGGLGESDWTRMGSTQYAKQVVKQLWGLPPALDMEREKAVQTVAREAARSGLSLAAHDLGEGGLAVALAEMTFSGIGLAANFTSTLSADMALFHEGPSRILVATDQPSALEALAQQHGVEALALGQSGGTHLKISIDNESLVDVPVNQLYSTWDASLEEALHVR